MTPRHPDGADGRRTGARAAAWNLPPGDFLAFSTETAARDGDDGDDGARLIREMLFHSGRIYVAFSSVESFA